MDLGKAYQIYKSGEYTDNKWKSSCPLSVGLEILNKYRSISKKYDFQFEHDQVYICNFEETVRQMTEEEVLTMFENGWFEDEDSWSLFS